MRVLFAVSNEEISEAIVKRYQKDFKEIISYKNVYYFNAIIKELQKDKNYDRIVISEELEAFTNTQYSQIDKFIFDKLDSISDEAANIQGDDIPIILICSDRREKGEDMLVKLFGIGIYNALLGDDRSVHQVCKLINRPRLKKDAKTYYEIDTDDVSYQAENENDVSEVEIQNILAHYRRLGKDEKKYVESFDNIASQYNDTQLKIIAKFLPLNVRAVLEEKSPKYQELISYNSKVSDSLRMQETKKKTKSGTSEKLFKTEDKILTKPVVIPSSVNMSGTKKFAKKLTQPRPVQAPNVNASVRTNSINNTFANNSNANKMPNMQNPQREENQKKTLSQLFDEENEEPQVNRPMQSRIDNTKNENLQNENIQNSNYNNSSSLSEIDRLINEEEQKQNSAQAVTTKKLDFGDDSEENEEVKSEEVAEPAEKVEEQPKKKGRGRPRKYPLPDPNAPAKPKRGRGRPRKNPLPEESQEETETSILPGVETEDDDDDDILPGLTSSSSQNNNSNSNANNYQGQSTNGYGGYNNNYNHNYFVTNKNGIKNDTINNGLNNNLNNYSNNINTNINNEYANSNNSLNETKNINNQNTDNNFAPQSNLNNYNNERPENYTEPFSRNSLQKTNEVHDDVDISGLLTSNKKVACFVGTSKNGTSFIVNNLADITAKMGIDTAILDTTQNRNSYYIYTQNDENLRKTAMDCIPNLLNGNAKGIQVEKNLTVYTSLPEETEGIENAGTILQTLLQKHSLILIDCDFETPISYFEKTQEIYLVQSFDILTIQPLTAFLRELKSKNVLEQNKLRVVLNKALKLRGVNDKTIIGGMAFYNDPAMSFMTELFDKDTIRYITVPFDEETYTSYLENIINCEVSTKRYPKHILQILNDLANMVYPLVSGRATYTPPTVERNANSNNSIFSASMNSTLDQMKRRY